jgi:hypothetical protein
LPLATFWLAGSPLVWQVPELQGFNFRGGWVIIPEMASLLLALTIYTAAFIAEIVRSGIQAVSHGQTEASFSLGLNSGKTLRLIILPQALRVIIPPLTNQYLNLTKNSSLAAAIGYPDMVSLVRRHRAEPDRPGHRMHRHHHGGLSGHQPADFAADELVQPAGRPGGALKAWPKHAFPIPICRHRPAPSARSAGCAATCSPRHFNIAADPAGIPALLVIDSAPAAMGGAGRHLERRQSRGLPGEQRRLLGVYPSPFRPVHVRLLPGSTTLAGQHCPAAADRRRRAAVRAQMPNQIKAAGDWASASIRSSPSCCCTGGLFGLAVVETSQWGGLLLTLVIAGVGMTAALPLGYCWRWAGARRCRRSRPCA